MSQHNIQGVFYAILNDKGNYELYSPTGEKIGSPFFKIRITQSVDEVDTMVFIGPVNVVKDKEEMEAVMKALACGH